MPVQAQTLIRKMRGGAQGHLIQAEDGHFYVLKSTNNPQHRRILVNEWLSCAFLRYLHIFVPETVLLELTPEFIAGSPDLYLSIGPRREPIPPGIHFGSRLAVDPARVAIFDFLPDKVLGKLENRVDFLGTLVFDKWTANTDSRQAVFFRARARHWTPLKGEAPARIGFFAQMINHGFAFNGRQWHFQDSPLQGVYFRTSVYDEVRSLDSFQPWLDMVGHFPIEVVDAAWKEIPRHWLDGDEDELERMLELLLKRRARVPEMIRDVQRNRSSAFANWR